MQGLIIHHIGVREGVLAVETGTSLGFIGFGVVSAQI